MFKDVPTDHWAYQAVQSLQSKGVVVGYPDGYFRGKRTLTRYEFAVALNKAIEKFGGGSVGPAGPAGEAGPAGPAGDVGPAGMTPEDVENLKKLVNEFGDELKSMRGDLRAVQAKLNSLAADVASIKGRLDKMPVISGGAWMAVRADRGNTYIDDMGHLFGAYDSNYGGTGANLRDTAAVVHGFDLNLDAKIAGGATLSTGLVVDNYLGFEDGQLATVAKGGYGYDSNDDDLYIRKLEITTPLGGPGRNSTITFGRYRYSHYWWMQKPVVDDYVKDPFDDQNYSMDGFKLRTNFGSVALDGFAGKFSSVDGIYWSGINEPVGALAPSKTMTGSIGKPVGQAWAGNALYMEQMAGMTLGVPIKEGMGIQGGHVAGTVMVGTGGSSTSKRHLHDLLRPVCRVELERAAVADR